MYLVFEQMSALESVLANSIQHAVLWRIGGTAVPFQSWDQQPLSEITRKRHVCLADLEEIVWKNSWCSLERFYTWAYVIILWIEKRSNFYIQRLVRIWICLDLFLCTIIPIHAIIKTKMKVALVCWTQQGSGMEIQNSILGKMRTERSLSNGLIK